MVVGQLFSPVRAIGRMFRGGASPAPPAHGDPDQADDKHAEGAGPDRPAGGDGAADGDCSGGKNGAGDGGKANGKTGSDITAAAVALFRRASGADAPQVENGEHERNGEGEPSVGGGGGGGGGGGAAAAGAGAGGGGGGGPAERANTEGSMETAPTAVTPTSGVYGAADGEVTSRHLGAGGHDLGRQPTPQLTPSRQASNQRRAIKGLEDQLRELHSELAAVKEDMRAVVQDAHEALNAAAQAGEEAADARYLAEADAEAIKRLQELDADDEGLTSAAEEDSEVSSEVLTRALRDARLRRKAARELSERVKARSRSRKRRRGKGDKKSGWYNTVLTVVLVLVGLKVLYELLNLLRPGSRVIGNAVPHFDLETDNSAPPPPPPGRRGARTGVSARVDRTEPPVAPPAPPPPRARAPPPPVPAARGDL